jgi:hypothetical protein
MLKHFQLHHSPSLANIPVGRLCPHTMQTIIIDPKNVVQPELAAIIGSDGKPVLATELDRNHSPPTNCEVIRTGET